MSIVSLTVHQLLIMAIYMLIGYILRRLNILTRAGSKDIAGMLVKLIIPAILINSFCEAYSPARLVQLLQCTVIAALLLGLSILISHLIYRGRPLEDFGASFSNAGFMGIPLVRAVFGAEAVFYIVPFVALLNVLQWTYGCDLLRGVKEKKTAAGLLRQLLWNPPMVGIGVGILIFLSGRGDALPSLAATTLSGICALNTPLAMMVLGVYLADEKLLTVFTTPSLYGASLVRLLLIPLLSILVLRFLPFSSEMSRAILLCAAAPVGANVAVYAQLYGKDYAHASKIVVLSTILSLVTLPLIAAVSALLPQ